jgi:hypothetical protein
LQDLAFKFILFVFTQIWFHSSEERLLDHIPATSLPIGMGGILSDEESLDSGLIKGMLSPKGEERFLRESCHSHLQVGCDS